MNAITERFLYFIDKKGLSDYQVWNSIEGLSKSSMSKIRGGIIDVSVKVLAPFCDVYNVNANWLLLGKGNVLISEEGGINESQEKNSDIHIMYEASRRQILLRDERIRDLEIELGLANTRCEELKKEVLELKRTAKSS